MNDYATILIRRYRSPDGAPTCCADHPAGQTCQFLGVRAFGTVDVCTLGPQRDLSSRTTGYQRPHAQCAVWADAGLSDCSVLGGATGEAP